MDPITFWDLMQVVGYLAVGALAIYLFGRWAEAHGWDEDE